MTNVKNILLWLADQVKQYKVVLIGFFCIIIFGVSLLFFIECFSRPYIGIELSKSNQVWTVDTVDNNGLANQSGIQIGDRPVEVNDQSAEQFLGKYDHAGLVAENVISQITVLNSQGQYKSISIDSSSPSLRSFTDVATFFFLSSIFWVVGAFVYFKRPNKQSALLLFICSFVLGLGSSANLAALRVIPNALEFYIIASAIGPWLLFHFFLVLPDERAWTRSNPLVYCIYVPAVITLILFPLIGYADGQPLPEFRTFRFIEYGAGFVAAAGIVVFNYFTAQSTRTRQQMKICLLAV